MYKAKILIGCPVRNRAWILPRYLQHLREIDSPLVKIEYAFVVNDSQDGTLAMLQGFSREVTNPVHLVTKNLNNNASSYRGGFSTNGLVFLRNMMLNIFLSTDCTHFFSIDSDILVGKTVMDELLKLKLPVVSALVRNDLHLGDYGIYNIGHMDEEAYHPTLSFPRGRVIQVDVTGAVYLIERSVIENCGVRYRKHRQGEDVGFCLDARTRGVSLWCHTGLECIHVMNESDGEAIGLGCEIAGWNK